MDLNVLEYHDVIFLILLLQEAVRELSKERLQEILLEATEEEPALIFHIMHPTEPPKPPSQGQPDWCTCGRCQKMPTITEDLCCKRDSENCVSMTPVSLWLFIILCFSIVFLLLFFNFIFGS